MPLAPDAPATRPITAEAALTALVLAGGSINGLAVRVVEDVAANGLVSPTLGVGPFQIIAIAVATWLCLKPAEAARPLPLWTTGLALLLMLVPSSAVSWLAVAGYAALLAASRAADDRSGPLLFLALAIAALWSSVGLKWLAAPVTTAEAYLVGQAVGLLRPDIVQSGNVIGTPDVHNLVLMTACTTSDALPGAAVALVAVGAFLGGVDARRLSMAVAALAAGYALANVVRLSAMAWSGEAYEIVHGPIGRNVFDLLQTVAVLGLGSWTSRP